MSPHEVLSAAAVDTNVVSAPGLVFPKLTFTDMLHVPAPAAPQFQPAEPQPLQHALNPATRYEIRGPEQEGAVWRTSDHPPLSYHCGDHKLRHFSYRRMGLQAFWPNAARPRYDNGP